MTDQQIIREIRKQIADIEKVGPKWIHLIAGFVDETWRMATRDGVLIEEHGEAKQ